MPEPVELGPKAGAVSAELTELDPIALAHVDRQLERSPHPVNAVAGRPEQCEVGECRFRLVGFAEPNATSRKAKAESARIAQAAIYPVIHEHGIRTAQQHLDHDRSAARDQCPPRLGPQPYRLWKFGCRGGDRGDVVAQRRRRHIRIADRKTATYIDDVDGDPGPFNRLACQPQCARIRIRIEALRADMERNAETSCVRPRSEERRVGKECRSRWSPYH